MSKTEGMPSRLTRRSFLKTTGAVTGTAVMSYGLTGCSLMSVSNSSDVEVEETVTPARCSGNCHGIACPLRVTVRDGKLVDIKKFDGYAEQNLECVCVKGYMNIERMYSTKRAKYPLRRTGERGSGEFERISWDEAIEEISTKWKRYQEEYGTGSIFFSSGSGAHHTFRDLLSRLANSMQGTMMPQPYDLNGYYTQMRHNGYTKIGYANDYRDIVNARTIIVWGTNPSESALISFHCIAEAREAGAQMVVIDPNFTTIAGKADKFVPIRPGSDGLLAIGMMQKIIERGNHDIGFLKTRTVSPFLVKDADGLYLRLSDLGRVDPESEDDRILVCDSEGKVYAFDELENPIIEGSFVIEGIAVTTAYSLLLDRIHEWSMEQIVEYTDITEETIEYLSEIILEGPTTVLTGFGMDHYANGHTAYENILALLDIAGQYGVPGAGITCTDNLTFIAEGVQSPAVADGNVASTLWSSYVYDGIVNGKVGDHEYNIKSAFFFGHNVLANMPERQKWLEVFEALDLVVVSDFLLTETTMYADIVLPATFLFEADEMVVQGYPMITYAKQAVEPPYDTKSDYEIFQMLGLAMGRDEDFGWETREDYFQAILDNDTARGNGITWERLKEEREIWSFPEEIFIIGSDTLPTATGRFEFYHEGLQPIFDAGKEWDTRRESLPYWIPPFEAWFENEKFEEYPLIFTSERSKFKTHTMFTWVDSLLEIDKEPYVKINPKDANERGIETGDTIKIYNDRGYVITKAVLNPGIRPGVLVIDHGWERDQFIEGHYNDLPSRDTAAGIPSPAYFDTLCQVAKVE